LLIAPIVNFIDEHEAIYGFLGFPEIYKTDLRTGQTIVSRPQCVNCSGLPAPYEGASGDARDTETYLRSYTRFVNLVWSEAEQKIYRFFLSPIPDRPTGSELFVSIHDRDLNYLGESKLPKGLMYFAGVPGNRGLYFPRVSDDEDQLSLLEIAASGCE